MAPGSTKKKPVGRMLVTGLLSIALYAVLFRNQDLVSTVFTRGGLYAFLPIGTALIFSFVHGAFTGHFWTVMGVEASKKKVEVK
jgi:F0F1-type ATP synthase assembly protein I